MLAISGHSKGYPMFTRIVIAVALVSSVAAAGDVKPGRCVIISEPGKAERLVCDVPPSEGCVTAHMWRADGSRVERTMCVQPLASR
jgi:hypothetical protein